MIPEPRVVDSGCNNRSKDDHSFLRKSRFLFCEIFFVSSVSSHSIFVRDNSKLVFFSNPEINFTKTCMHACKILQVLPKVKKSPKVITGVNPSKTRISQKSLPEVKNHCSSLARTRARPHAHAHAVYILI